MGSIIYKKMSLFDAEPGSVLVHACNTRGVWGSGIAKVFKEKFPTAYSHYNKYCKDFGLIGTAPIFEEGDYSVVCLLTSSGYADTLDSKDKIIVNTTLALNNFCSNEHWRYYGKRPVYSNKFNSGLFNVPWEETERILKVFVDRYDLEWIVCDPNMEG